MKCEDCSKMLFDYIWGTLDVQSATSIKAHLESGCLTCNNELELLQGSSFALASELLPVRPPAEIKQHVMSLVAMAGGNSHGLNSQSVPTTGTIETTPSLAGNYVQLSPPATDSSWRKWSLALAGCLIGIVGGYAIMRNVLNPAPELVRKEATLEHGNPQSNGAGIRMVKLASTNITDDKGAQAAGHVVFDLVANQVHVLTSKLLNSSPAAADYDVWVTDDNNQNLLLGKLQKSDTQGVWFNYFDLPHKVMNIDQIAIASSSEKGADLQPADVRLRVRITPPVKLK